MPTAQEYGVVLQRDKETYAIVTHTPQGLLSPETLRRVADVADKYQLKAIKITSANRLALIGFKEHDIDQAWQDLGATPGAAVGLCVRSIKCCPGTTFCRLGQQDSLALAAELDQRYHGLPLPNKFKIGVSGCPNSCGESSVKDLGFVGRAKGWTILVGGNAASRPRIADKLIDSVSSEEALRLSDKIITYFNTHGKKGQRLGHLIESIGLDTFRQAILD